MLLETFSSPLRKVRSVNQTSNGYVSKVPTLTPPAADVGTATGQATIATVPEGGGVSPQNLLLLPYGVGADTNTMLMKVLFWRFIPALNGVRPLWIPQFMAIFTCTLESSIPGIAGSDVVATELFCGTIALTTGNAVNCIVNNPNGGAEAASCIIKLDGATKVEVTFSVNASSTSCNALYAMF